MYGKIWKIKVLDTTQLLPDIVCASFIKNQGVKTNNTNLRLMEAWKKYYETELTENLIWQSSRDENIYKVWTNHTSSILIFIGKLRFVINHR